MDFRNSLPGYFPNLGYIILLKKKCCDTVFEG